MSSRKKGLTFARFYFGLIFLILVSLIVVFFYVRGVLVDYENSSADKYILSELSRAGAHDGSIGEYLQDRCFAPAGNPGGNPASRKQLFYQNVSKSDLKVEKNLSESSTEIQCFDVYNGDKAFISVWLKQEGVKNKLGILNIPTYSLQNVIYRNTELNEDKLVLNENGKLDYEIVVPEGFSLYFDDVKYSIPENTERVSLKEFKDFGDYDCLPRGYNVVLKDLSYEMKVSVKNNNDEEVLVEKKKDGSYAVSVEYSENAEAKDTLSAAVDPVAIAKLWVDFMQNDVGGPKHGLDKVVSGCKIINNSPMYDKAYLWGTSVDITFVSDHNAKTFKDEDVKNFVRYNDNLISCDVYFNTIIPVTYNGALRNTVTQTYYNRMFFMYVSDTNIASPGWYWIGSVALEQ